MVKVDLYDTNIRVSVSNYIVRKCLLTNDCMYRVVTGESRQEDGNKLLTTLGPCNVKFEFEGNTMEYVCEERGYRY